MNTGEIIRKFRTNRKMTLLELSRKSGVALATLSRIENGRMTGTIESHIRICGALDVTLPELYKDLPSSKRTPEVQTKSSKPDVFIQNKKATYESLASNATSKKMAPVLIRVTGGGSTNTEEFAPGTEKFVYILEGRIEAHIGEERYSLTRGDTLYFSAAASHYFRNTGAGDARLLAVVSQPA